MKTERDNERMDEQIVNLLTPKHAPRCNVSFSVPESPKRVSWWRYVRTVGVAAVVMIGVFFGAKIQLVSMAYFISQWLIPERRILFSGIETNLS